MAATQMKHFLILRGIDRPTLAEKSKAERRIEAYFLALPDLRHNRSILSGSTGLAS